MFENLKYHGEIWLPENESEKFFCVLEFLDKKVFLETNLSSRYPEYKKDLIYGAFNGLGFLTFINNSVNQSSIGIIDFRKYNPKYIFVSSDHLIDPYNLKIKEFKIINSVFNEWIRSLHWFNKYEDKLEKAEDIKHSILIKERLLEIVILKTTNYISDLNSFNLVNVGYVSFNSKNELGILEAIEIYNTFQKFLLFFYGQSKHFKSFNMKYLESDNWFSLYYNDSMTNENHSSFIHFDYRDFKYDLSEVLQKWYINEDVQFCSDIILENILTIKVSHSRRFTNSLASFEALNKRFGVNHKNPSSEKYFNDFKDGFVRIMKIEETTFKIFVKKIIRTRDYYVHGNKKQSDIFSKFELLYISFLIDFIVGIELSKQLGVSQENINKIIDQAESVYLGMQSTNRILNESIL